MSYKPGPGTGRYGPREGLRVVWLSRGEAEAFTRRTHNVSDDVGLGWQPYTITVTSYGALAHTAFTSARAFRRWLGQNYRLTITGRGAGYKGQCFTGVVSDKAVQ